MITEEQIDFIDAQIQKSQIKDKRLKDDLLDHLCCLVEVKLSHGVDFENAYKSASAQLAPNGFEEIQHETIFLINQRRIMTLRRMIFLSGYLFLLVSLTGLYFKKMHWPFATQLLITGVAGLVFIFLPLIVFSKFKYLSGQLISFPSGWIPGSLFAGVVAAVLMITMTGMSGFGVIISCFFFILGFVLMPIQFFKMYKRSIKLT